MKKTEENKEQAVPVVKQLARPMSVEELASVAGADGGCAPGATSTRGAPDDYLQ